MGRSPAADGFREHGIVLVFTRQVAMVMFWNPEPSRRNSKLLLWIGKGKPSGAGSNTPSGV
jgi:hypothetical protein